ncbi:MAG: hypothetical protein MJE12_25255 [Alphaproteobacteria bacterium]|nr:hypothetical protein [Alphaproteobacteria bacterium]
MGVATASALPNSETLPPMDFAAQMDSLHILPLRIVPLRTTALNSANLIKNARLETVVEVYRNSEGVSGQVAVEEIWTVLELDPEDPEYKNDRRVLANLGGLYSFDVYTLRKVLRALGIQLNDHEALRLSPQKAEELAMSMRGFTQPLLSQVYSGMETEITDFDELINLFKSPDKEAALKNLQVMANKLQIDLVEIPAFLEDYGDIFLSLAYFRECLDDLIPKITMLVDDIGGMRESHQLRADRNLMKTCDHMEERLTDITTSITGRFENFHQHSNEMWKNVTAESFRRVKELVAGHHMTLGGVLCGLAVKMSLWDERFADGKGSLMQRAEFIMTEMRHGIDVIDRIEQSAPSLTDIRN